MLTFVKVFFVDVLIVRWHDFPRDGFAHDEESQRVVITRDEVQGRCSAKANVLDMERRVFCLLLTSSPKSGSRGEFDESGATNVGESVSEISVSTARMLGDTVSQED